MLPTGHLSVRGATAQSGRFEQKLGAFLYPYAPAFERGACCGPRMGGDRRAGPPSALRRMRVPHRSPLLGARVLWCSCEEHVARSLWSLPLPPSPMLVYCSTRSLPMVLWCCSLAAPWCHGMTCLVLVVIDDRPMGLGLSGGHDEQGERSPLRPLGVPVPCPDAPVSLCNGLWVLPPSILRAPFCPSGSLWTPLYPSPSLWGCPCEALGRPVRAVRLWEGYGYPDGPESPK